MDPIIGDKESRLTEKFRKELQETENEFCNLLSLDFNLFQDVYPDEELRIGMMTLFDFYKTKLKIFKKTPKYFRRLEWGIKYHFLGSAKTALQLGKNMKLAANEVLELCISAFFHDIAKIKYDNDFFIRKLSRPDKRILQHPIESFQLAVTYCGYFSSQVLFGILQHHEYFNGNGYPLQLKGKQISLFARIISIADSYSAMMETREFSSRKETVKDVLEEIEACKGTQFDPEIADIFIKSNPGHIGA